jgi:hypothetical protein
MASARSRRLFLKRSSALSARRACCSTWLLSHAICAASDAASDAAQIAWLSSQVKQQARRADNAELRFKKSLLERAEAIRDRDLALKRKATLRYRLDEAIANLSSLQQRVHRLEKSEISCV